VVPAGGLGMRETKLLIGGSDNADARLREVARFIRTNREAERRRVNNDETVAAIGNVDLSAPWPATSSGASSRSANEGKFSMLMRSALPLRTPP